MVTRASRRRPPIAATDVYLESEIGEGANCEVYTAEYLEQRVVVKVLKRGDDDHARRLRCFQRELNVLERLSHPNIARTFGYVSSHHKHMIMLEYLEGGDLQQRLAKEQIMPLECLQIARQVVAGLQALHEASPPVIHRDLKPANLVFTAGYQSIKIVDLGLSRRIRLSRAAEVSNRSSSSSSDTSRSEENPRRHAPTLPGSIPFSPEDAFSPFAGSGIRVANNSLSGFGRSSLDIKGARPNNVIAEYLGQSHWDN